MPKNNCENRLLSLLSAQEWHLDRLYGEYSKELGSLFKNQKGAISKMQRAQLEKVMLSFNSDLESTLTNQINNSFGISNTCSDDLAKNYLKGMDVKGSQLNNILANNPNAASAFIARKAAGLNLSDRVWAITGQTKDQLENVLEQGIFNGRPATEMARDIKGYLKEPNRQFRRVRNAEGKLILSNPAKDYHPGQGVYRSSYKNALRVSRNEINIAYRTNDFERRKNMPFVMGQKVRLSAAHPEFDICDELQGTYPKNFKFIGWHPNCLCFTEALLLPRDKFKEYLGGGEIDNRHLINNIPKTAQDYLNLNADKLRSYKNPPYFLKDNFKFSDGKYAPKVSALNPTPKVIAPVVSDAFTEAKSISEAENFAIKNGLSNKVDYSRLTVDGANVMNRRLAAAKKKYNLQTLNDLNGNISTPDAGGMANGKNMIINKNAFLEKRVGKKFNKDKYKRFAVSDSYDLPEYSVTIVDHEIGHIIADQQFGQINGKELLKAKLFGQTEKQGIAFLKKNDATINKMFKDPADQRIVRSYVNNFDKNTEWSNLHKKYNNPKYTKDFSEYGFYMKEEFFAECYAMNQRGEILPDDILQFFNNL